LVQGSIRLTEDRAGAAYDLTPGPVLLSPLIDQFSQRLLRLHEETFEIVASTI